MSGFQFITSFQFDEPIAALDRAAGLDKSGLLDGLGALGASQTKRRLEEEKTGPDGEAWKANAEGSSLLFQTGALADSVDHQAEGSDAVAWGSALVYAAVHQFGAVIKPDSAKTLAFSIGGSPIFAKEVTIPARPYVGISQDNARELEGAALRFVGEVLQ
jgi:phage gpG-like protein